MLFKTHIKSQPNSTPQEVLSVVLCRDSLTLSGMYAVVVPQWYTLYGKTLEWENFCSHSGNGYS